MDELSIEQVDSLVVLPVVAKYLAREIEFTGNALDAIINACCVTFKGDVPMVEDLDCRLFKLTWDPTSRRWV